MSFQIQMEQMPGYLAARFIGAGVPGEASLQFESIALHCKHTNNDKLGSLGIRVVRPISCAS
jgi:hypothetical protein